MAKRIHHMGMVVGRKAHEDFHKRAPELSPRQHQALMTRLGITPEQDIAWHKTHLTLGEQRARGLKQVDLCALGAGFSNFCVRKGWMLQNGKDYFANKEGLRELRSRFDIEL